MNHLTILATEKACTTSYPNTLRANYWETCTRAFDCIGNYDHGCSYMIGSVGKLFQAILGFALYLLLLSNLEPVLLILVIFTTVIGYFVSRKMSEWGYIHREESKQYRKTIRYISNELMANEMPKDIRIFGMQPWLSDIYNSALALYANFCARRETKVLFANLMDVLLVFLRNGFAYLYLIQMALNQNISASTFLLYFTAVTGFTNWVTTILEHAIKLHRQSLNTNEYRELLEYPEPFKFEDGLPLKKDVSKDYTITLEDVSFRYPDTEKDTHLPNGLDTYLYHQLKEDGVSISGGEAQKIAIARALYKDAPFLILDEPTAALDPIAEAEIYSNLNTIIDDKTAIYISHRLSSCRFCDDILVFHEGNVVQQGSHDMLVSDVNGKYYELWNAQAQYYVTI